MKISELSIDTPCVDTAAKLSEYLLEKSRVVMQAR